MNVLSVNVAPLASPPSQLRSAVSNGSRVLDGVDGRSSAARRFRDLALSFASELGGESALTEPQKALVRHAAALTIQSEALHASIVRGEPVDSEQLVRVSNTLARTLKDLGILTKAKVVPPSLKDYLASGEPAP
jgi:hypothetical protein